MNAGHPALIVAAHRRRSGTVAIVEFADRARQREPGQEILAQAAVDAELAGQHRAVPGEGGLRALQHLPLAPAPHHRPAGAGCHAVIGRCRERQPEGRASQHIGEGERIVLDRRRVGSQRVIECRSPGQRVGGRLFAARLVHARTDRPVGDIGEGQRVLGENLVVQAPEARLDHGAFSVDDGQGGPGRCAFRHVRGQRTEAQRHPHVVEIVVLFGLFRGLDGEAPGGVARLLEFERDGPGRRIQDIRIRNRNRIVGRHGPAPRGHRDRDLQRVGRLLAQRHRHPDRIAALFDRIGRGAEAHQIHPHHANGHGVRHAVALAVTDLEPERRERFAVRVLRRSVEELARFKVGRRHLPG